MSSRLLFVNASLTDGGSERAMSLVAQALAWRGHDVTMVLVREKECTYPIDARIVVKQLRYPRKDKIRMALQRMRQIRREVRTGRYDLVVSYMWDLNLTTLLATLGLGARVVVSERGFPGAGSRSRVSRALESVLYRFAHRIVYQTEDAREYCPLRLRDRSVVVPNVIETAGLEPYSGARAKRIVSIGRLRAQKNFPLLLRAFAEFRESHPDWTLEIYGRGELEGELRMLARDLGIEGSVVFAGYVVDVASRIRDAGIFALASDYEGISNAMSEAMALGLPAVCTDCPAGGAALLIEHRVSGMLVPVRDRRALADALREVASDPALAEHLSAGARESVARFAPGPLALAWEERVLHK